MLDDTNIAQQEAVGILGVNLIHSAFSSVDEAAVDISNFIDNREPGRLEVDLVDLSGPALQATDSIAAAMVMIRNGLAEAVLLDISGQQQPPTAKRPCVLQSSASTIYMPAAMLPMINS